MNSFKYFLKLKKLERWLNEANVNEKCELLSIINEPQLSSSIKSTKEDILKNIKNISATELYKLIKMNEIPINIDLIIQINDRLANNSIDIECLIDSGYIQQMIQFWKNSNVPIPDSFGFDHKTMESIRIDCDIITMLVEIISNPHKNKNILHVVIQFTSSIYKGSASGRKKLMIHKYFLNKLLSLCNPNSSIEVMTAVAHIIKLITKREGYDDKLLANKLSLLVMYDDPEILRYASFGFTHLFRRKTNVEFASQHKLFGDDLGHETVLKHSIKSALIRNNLLVNGYVINSNDISIPFVIIKLIECYYSPFGIKSSIDRMEFNGIKKLITVLKYPTVYSIAIYSIITLLYNIIRYYRKYVIIASHTLNQMMMIDSGMVDALKNISRHKFDSNATNVTCQQKFNEGVLCLIFFAIKIEDKNKREWFLWKDLLFIFTSNMLKQDILTLDQQQKISRIFRNVPSMFKNNILNKLKQEPNISKENKGFLFNKL